MKRLNVWIGSLIEKGLEAFSRLSERERLLVLAMATVVLTFSSVGLTVSTIRGIDKTSRLVTSKTDQLRQVLSLRDAYRRSEEQNNALRVRLQHNDLRLVALVEEEAKKMGLELGNLSPHDLEADGAIKTQYVELRVQKLTYDKVTTFCEHLESQANPVKIIRLHLTQRFDEKDLVDMELTVATYKAS